MTRSISSSSGSRRIKIGVDVGGTFTHAVALDADTFAIVGKAVVPTTHASKEGVARGVVESMQQLLKAARIRPSQVVLIAHSTTQATNALLEGDVAPVGIIGMGKGMEGWRAKSQTNIQRLELAPGKYLTVYHRYYDSTNGLDENRIRQLARDLKGDGAQVFVVSEAFGVDHPENEQKAVAVIREMGYLATAGSEISQLYGLRVRTRTAAINASMLPKMLETADLTERSVRASGIKAPLMIMRSDGGVMDIHEMRRRPIMTMLSGPAAGVAAALMYAKISDGIFLEVGGTSTDISIIRNGRPVVRSAEVGGHKLYVRTLDIRTVGIGGGSMVRLSGKKIADVGPRSAHIAGLNYISFARPDKWEEPELVRMAPKPGDPDDYAAVSIKGARSPSFALTATEAANVLGYANGYARGVAETIDNAYRWLATILGRSAEEIAQEILDVSAAKVMDVVRQLIQEYKLDASMLVLVGGGGGAEVIVPHAATKFHKEFSIAENAEIVSAIGVALGMIRDTVERSVVNPTDADILRIRAEAADSVIRMGAAHDSVEVRVEVDTRQKRLIATATGAPEMRTRTLRTQVVPDAQLKRLASVSMGVEEDQTRVAGETKFLRVFQCSVERRKLFGLSRVRKSPARVVDREGIIRLKLADVVLCSGTVGDIGTKISRLVEDLTVFGDAGGLHPDVFVLVSGRIIDLSGLVSKEQILTLARAELDTFSREEQAVALVAKKS